MQQNGFSWQTETWKRPGYSCAKIILPTVLPLRSSKRSKKHSKPFMHFMELVFLKHILCPFSTISSVKKISIEDLYIDDLIVISDYYETDRYPGPRYVMPTRSEVEHFFLLTERLSKSGQTHLKIFNKVIRSDGHVCIISTEVGF